MFPERNGLLLFLTVILLGATPVSAAAPTFTAFSPTSGKLGTTVTLTGTNFTAPLTVTFNGVASTAVTVVSTTKATATVPPTASTGKITLKDAGGSVTGGSAFTVVAGLTTSATTGHPTATVTLTYSGFAATEPVDFYLDDDDFALGTSSANGAGSVAVVVPKDAPPGAHWITAVGRRSVLAAQIPFRVRTEWTLLGMNARRLSNNPYESVLTAGSVPDLQEQWRTVGVAPVASTPIDVGNVVYATFGDGTVRAYSETTGAQKWSTMIGSTGMRSSPTVSAGMLYVGSDNDRFYALNASTGAILWSFPTGGSIYSSPIVANGLVYFGSNDNSVYALNATTGNLVWSKATSGAVPSSPAVYNGVVYASSTDGQVYAYNAASGAFVWMQGSPHTGIPGSPVLFGGMVCHGLGNSDQVVSAQYASSGGLAWSYVAQAQVKSAPAVVGNSLFFGDDAGTVYSLTAAGALRWTYELPPGSAVQGPLCAANDVVYVSDGHNTYLFAQADGKLLATLPVGSGTGGPIVVNGAVLVGDVADGVLSRYTLDGMQTGASVAPRPEPSQLRPHPLP